MLECLHNQSHHNQDAVRVEVIVSLLALSLYIKVCT